MSHSLDPHHDRSSSEADLMDSPRPTFPQYRILADYTALTQREVNLHEGEVVELVKIGCAGWWYVRLTGKAQLFLHSDTSPRRHNKCQILIYPHLMSS